MVREDMKVSAIINAQFRCFREDNVLESGYSDEELGKAAKGLRVQSMADARFAVDFHLFMRKIIQSAQWN